MKRTLWLVALLAVLGGGLFAYLRIRAALGPAPTPAEIEALEKQRHDLRDRFRELLDEQNLLDLAHAPSGNILVGVPAGFTEDLVGEMLRGLLSEVRLRLQDLHARTEGDVKAKVVFTQKLGHFILDVDIKDIRALLKPGPPELKFGGDKIGIKLPVTVAEGRGTANVHFQWEGKGLAGTVCGDLDVSPDVSSDVKPTTYILAGGFVLTAEGETVVAKPRFGEVVLKVVLKPTEETWAKVARAVEDVKNDKNGICAMAIQKLDVRALVQKIIDKGFDVKLPPKLFKPIVLPATVEQSVDIHGRTVSLDARPIGLRITPSMLWYGAALGAEAAPPSPAASPRP